MFDQNIYFVKLSDIASNGESVIQERCWTWRIWGEELEEEGRLIHHRTHRKGEQHVQELHKNTWDICYHKKRFLNLELNMTFDIECVILMSPLTMATMTPMANLDTKSWLSSMVVTIFVKHPSNACLKKNKLWHQGILLSVLILRMVWSDLLWNRSFSTLL